MTERYRNHPIVIARSILASFILIAVIAVNIIANGQEGGLSAVGSRGFLILLLPLAFLIYGIICWSKTYITLEEDHAVAERWVLYKTTKVIPYGKVASINEVRGIIGRIIGCTTLQININSSHNASRPELVFTFRDDLAQYVSKALRYGAKDGKPTGSDDALSAEEPEAAIAAQDNTPDEADLLYRFNAKDAIMFGIFGSNTWSLLITLFFGIYSVVNTLFMTTASIVSMMFMVFSGIIPMVMSIIRNGNFRIYRNGDKIRLIHGMTTIYDTTFDVSRVNAVTVKRSLFARLIHKCCIEAEVVGINARDGDVTPTVTLLIPESELGTALGKIFPEIDFDYELHKQPASALRPNVIRGMLFSVPIAIFFALILYCAWKFDEEFDNVDLALLLLFILTPLAIMIPRGFLVHRMYRIGYSDHLFTIRTGVIDTKECTMQYSKIQISETVATPFVRKKGLARASFSILSSAGAKEIGTGFYPVDELTQVGENAVRQSGMKLIHTGNIEDN